MKLPISLALLLLAAAPAFAADPPAADVAAAFPAADGLAVQIGASDPAFVASLTNDGKRLVHALALDDASRDKLRAGLLAAKVHPLASTATWHAPPRLPYADRLVNLLILDRDALGPKAPTDQECQRVVAPGGAILARSGGAWKATPVTRPAGWANWTHFDGGPDGNAVSADAEATALRSLQWIDNAREPRWTKTGPHGGDQGNIRVAGRYAVIDMHVQPMDKDPKFPSRVLLECRDVNNGLVLWQKTRKSDVANKRWTLAVNNSLCFTWLKDDGLLTALDLATGNEVRTYPGSEIKPYMQEGRREKKLYPQTGMEGENHWIRVVGNTILANGNGPLQAWTLDGKPLWTFSVDGQRLELPAVDESRKVVYGIMIKNDPVDEWGHGPMYWGRWPSSSKVVSIVALDLATGAKKWENTDIASRPSGKVDWKTKDPIPTAFGQLIAAGDYVVATNSNAIGGGQVNLVASLDAATGKTLQYDPQLFDKSKLDFNSYDAVYRDGLIYILNPTTIAAFNPKTGELTKVFGIAWNGRCAKPIATTDKFLVGQTAFLNKDFSGDMFAMARSGCARSPVPGSGLILFGPHLCSCVTHFDGFFATSSRPAPTPLPDAQRLVKTPNAPAPANLPAAAPIDPKSLLAQAWPWYTISEPVKPTTVEKAGWSFSIDPQSHRLDASKDNAKWSFLADARIGTDFAVVNNTVVLGSHDGWVHALDLATGKPRWRCLVAPAQRLIIANGMLTSAWPVFGVADLGNGQIVASAGTHAELDGGIRVVALNANDGSPVWTKNLGKKPTHFAPAGAGAGGKRGTPIAEFSLINAAPSVADGKISINGGEHLNRLDFAPDEPESAINARLAAQPRR